MIGVEPDDAASMHAALEAREQADLIARQFQDPTLAEAMALLAVNIATKRHRNHRKDFPC